MKKFKKSRLSTDFRKLQTSALKTMGNLVVADQAEELTIKILQIKEFSCRVQTSGKLNSSTEHLGSLHV